MAEGEAPLGTEIRDAVERALREIGVDERVLRTLIELGSAIAEQLPELVSPARREAMLAHATTDFYLPLGQSGMSDPQRALLAALLQRRLTTADLRKLLVQWAGSVNLDEPIDVLRLDCARLADVLRRGALRIYAIDLLRCEEVLEAIDRLIIAQAGVLAALARNSASPAGAASSSSRQYSNFAAQLRAQLEAPRIPGYSLAVMIVNSGVIERIDGAWGFQAGDLVRSKIVQRLRNVVLRAGDALVDLSRDELICVLPSVSGAGVALLAAQKILRVLGAAVRIGEGEIYARPAIGIALHPDHGDSPARLLQRAKIACQSASGRPERVVVFSDSLENTQAETLAFEGRLREAIDAGTLALAFQPQVSCASGKILAAETLLRWEDELLGLVPPHKAIAVAESAGLVNEVAWWVINNALRQCSEFRKRGLDIAVSVNLSPYNLRERDLPDFIDRGLRTWGVPADQLIIEITESAVLGASAEIIETLKRIKDCGVRLAIDDFGTGYASMSYLSAVPLDMMKIDRSFVGDMLRNRQHERIVRALIGLAHEFGMQVVAEGVEDEAVLERLRELGCDRMQGFQTGPPLSAEELVSRFAPAT